MGFRVEWKDNAFFLIFEGVISAQELDTGNRAFYNDPRSDTAKLQVCDFSKVEKLLLTSSDIKKVVAYDLGSSQIIPVAKVALVAPNDEIKSICNEYMDLANHYGISWDIAVFDNRDAALKWGQA